MQTRFVEKSSLSAKTFSASLLGFEVDAMNVRRGFQVAMAINVFGVGTLLPNELPRRGSLRNSH